MTTAADAYRRSGSRLDDHMTTCGSCSSGVACGAGDDVAEAEFRAWRQWERDDKDATRAHRKAAFPW